MKNKLLFVWNHFEEILLVPAFAVSTILIFVQVVLRCFGHPLAWSEELVRYMYIWETWLGVSYATRRGSQLRITMVRDKFTGIKKEIIEWIVTIIWIAFAAFVFYEGIRAMGTISRFGQLSSALRIPMQYCYLSIPVGMCMMVIRIIEGAIKNILKAKAEKGEMS